MSAGTQVTIILPTVYVSELDHESSIVHQLRVVSRSPSTSLALQVNYNDFMQFICDVRHVDDSRVNLLTTR